MGPFGVKLAASSAWPISGRTPILSRLIAMSRGALTRGGPSSGLGQERRAVDLTPLASVGWRVAGVAMRNVVVSGLQQLNSV